MMENITPDEILIVDDTPANLKLLSQILASQGYKVRVAVNGSQALASVALAAPDLILLDIKMPGMNGFEVCQQLKANPGAEEIPIIFISALDDLKDRLQGFQSGGVDYITKPFQLEEVLARVRTHLFIRRAQQKLASNNQRMQHELDLAGQLQMSFLPRDIEQMAGWQFSSVLQPARETSGDFYDMLTLPGGKIAILMADVVDKGVAAALLMVLAWSLLRECIFKYPQQPEHVFAEVNTKMTSILHESEFVTVFLGILDLENGRLIYSNAGQYPPLWFNAANNSILELGRTGVPLGVMEESTWTQSEITLETGDVLLLYTDGLTEACDKTGGSIGLEHLKACVLPLISKDAKQIKEYIEKELHHFLAGESPQDDMTLMVVKRKSRN